MKKIKDVIKKEKKKKGKTGKTGKSVAKSKNVKTSSSDYAQSIQQKAEEEAILNFYRNKFKKA